METIIHSFVHQGIYWLIGAIVVGIALIILIARARRSKQPNELIGTGIPAQATILACRATGKTTMTGPELELILHVQLPNQVPYQATTHTTGQPYEPAFQVGKEVQAWVDRRNQQRVAVVPSAAMASAGFGSPTFTSASNFSTNSNFTSTTINVDGVTYTDPNQLPPELRQKFNQAMGLLKDGDNDGVPDIFNQAVGQWDRQAESLKAVESLKWMVKNGKMSQSHALQGLQGLLDSGSISQAVYDTARTDLLNA